MADLKNFCIEFLVLELQKTKRQGKELTVQELFGRATVNQGAVVKMTWSRGHAASPDTPTRSLRQPGAQLGQYKADDASDVIKSPHDFERH